MSKQYVIRPKRSHMTINEANSFNELVSYRTTYEKEKGSSLLRKKFLKFSDTINSNCETNVMFTSSFKTPVATWNNQSIKLTDEDISNFILNGRILTQTSHVVTPSRCENQNGNSKQKETQHKQNGMQIERGGKINTIIGKVSAKQYSSVLIQKIFRGFFVRKHYRRLKLLIQLQSKIQRIKKIFIKKNYFALRTNLMLRESCQNRNDTTQIKPRHNVDHEASTIQFKGVVSAYYVTKITQPHRVTQTKRDFLNCQSVHLQDDFSILSTKAKSNKLLKSKKVTRDINQSNEEIAIIPQETLENFEVRSLHKLQSQPPKGNHKGEVIVMEEYEANTKLPRIRTKLMVNSLISKERVIKSYQTYNKIILVQRFIRLLLVRNKQIPFTKVISQSSYCTKECLPIDNRNKFLRTISRGLNKFIKSRRERLRSIKAPPKLQGIQIEKTARSNYIQVRLNQVVNVMRTFLYTKENKNPTRNPVKIISRGAITVSSTFSKNVYSLNIRRLINLQLRLKEFVKAIRAAKKVLTLAKDTPQFITKEMKREIFLNRVILLQKSFRLWSRKKSLKRNKKNIKYKPKIKPVLLSKETKTNYPYIRARKIQAKLCRYKADPFFLIKVIKIQKEFRKFLIHKLLNERQFSNLPKPKNKKVIKTVTVQNKIIRKTIK